MFTARNPNAITKEYLKALVNCTLENDHWETEPGARLLNAVPVAAAPLIVTLWHWEPAPGVRRMVACDEAGFIHKSSDDGATWIQLGGRNPLS
jgi:hypothetical protein